MSALIVRDDAQLSVVITQEASKLKESALESASLVRKVENADQQAIAVEAMTEIEKLLKSLEEARKIAKEPILEYGRTIDSKAKEFREKLEAEKMRIGRLVGDFQAVLETNARAAEALQKAELSEIDQRRQSSLASAQSHEEIDAINERANQEAQMLTPVAAPVKAEGQVIKPDWEIEVFNIDLLNTAYPGCVKKEPKLREIKTLLGMGVTLPGVNAKKIIKAGVRLQREPAAIEA